MDIIKYIAIGLTVGLLSGAVGIGGGVLMLPALMWICNLEPNEAAGTTLAILVVPVVLPAAWEYYIRGYVNLKAVGFIAVAFAVGGYTGAFLRNQEVLHEVVLRVGLGLIMVYIGLNMIVMSDSMTAKAAAGLTATAVAWLAYLGLGRLGKRALARPKLDEQIQRMQQDGRGDPDYYI